MSFSIFKELYNDYHKLMLEHFYRPVAICSQSPLLPTLPALCNQ